MIGNSTLFKATFVFDDGKELLVFAYHAGFAINLYKRIQSADKSFVHFDERVIDFDPLLLAEAAEVHLDGADKVEVQDFIYTLHHSRFPVAPDPLIALGRLSRQFFEIHLL